MGGDQPMDVQCAFDDILGVGDDAKRTVIREQMLKPSKFRRLVEYVNGETDDYRNIAGQVLGVCILRTGVPMSDSVRKLILDCARKDEWATYEPDATDRFYAKAVESQKERKSFINHFIRQIERYPAQGRKRATYVAAEGLFEKIAKNMVQGKEGLVNEFTKK